MKTILALTLSLVSFYAMADAISDVIHQSQCEIIAQEAELAMKARQENKDLSKQVAITQQAGFKVGLSQTQIQVKIDLLIFAYQQDLHYTDESKARAVMEFKNAFYLKCMTSSP